MACMPCAESKRACSPTHREDHKMLNIAERIARALERQKEALKTQWEILVEMWDFMKQIA